MVKPNPQEHIVDKAEEILPPPQTEGLVTPLGIQ